MNFRMAQKPKWQIPFKLNLNSFLPFLEFYFSLFFNVYLRSPSLKSCNKKPALIDSKLTGFDRLLTITMPNKIHFQSSPSWFDFLCFCMGFLINFFSLRLIRIVFLFFIFPLYAKILFNFRLLKGSWFYWK